MIAPARLAAYQILSAISAGRADLPTAIAHRRESLRDDRDRALAADIATGVQRQRAALDYLIATTRSWKFSVSALINCCIFLVFPPRRSSMMR